MGFSWFKRNGFQHKFFYGATIAFPVAITFYDLVGSVVKVVGLSMQPTLNPLPEKNDIVFLWKWNKYNLSRGDVVVLKSPKDPSLRLIKRVIGLEGDLIKTFGYKTSDVLIPEGHIWVEGDRTYSTFDSNVFGPVPVGLVIGKALWIVWPPDRFQSLSNEFVRPKLKKIKNTDF